MDRAYPGKVFDTVTDSERLYRHGKGDREVVQQREGVRVYHA